MKNASGSYERTRNSMRNSFTALSLQLLVMLAGFFSRKIFIEYLGTEVVGLNTTAASILNFLNLAELGIGVAVAVTLYRPLLDRDERTIREIVSLQGGLYRIIGSIVIAGSLAVMLFFPQIFSKTDLPLWYPYAAFSVLLYSSLLKYFFNYKKNVLYADQQHYKVLSCSRSVTFVKLILQALAVRCLADAYVWWLLIEAVSATVATILVMRIVYKAFPGLKKPVEDAPLLRKKYPDVLRKVRWLAFHKIGYFAVSQLSPLVVYAFSSLTTVALYGNYILLTTNLYAILTSVFTGMEASVGNMVAEGNKKLILKVFRELFSVRFLFVGICCICLWMLTDPFITVWLGSRYLLGKTTLALIIVLFYITNTRSTVDIFLDAYGMFRDIWAPVLEAAVNIGMSILLGKFYGLDGVLTGIIISQFAVGFFWKPVFLFKWGLKESLSFYVKLYARHLLIFAVSFIAVTELHSALKPAPAASLWIFLLHAVIVLAVSTIVFGGLLLLLEKSARGVLLRVRRAVGN